MRLIQQLKTVPLYFDYFLNVVDEHSIQAPFAFQFYIELRKRMQQSHGFEEIEKARKIHENDNAAILGFDYGAGSRVTRSRTVSSIARHGISSRKDCILFHELANVCEAKICIELGTSLGIATSYLAKSKQLETVYTFEGNDYLVQKSKQLFCDLQLNNVQIVHGNIDQTLPKELDQIDQLDLVIIDANHTRQALLHYFDLLKSKISEKGIMVVDDIRWSMEMYHTWEKLLNSHEVTLSMDFLNKGLLFFEKGLRKQHYVLSF